MNPDVSEPRTLIELLERSRERHAQRPALTFRGRGGRTVWTYADLARNADRFAALLADRGIGPGERIMIWAPNQPWWVAAFFGCLKAGVVVVPLDARGSADFSRQIGQLTRARLLVTSAELADSLAGDAIPVVRIEELDELLPSDTAGLALPEIEPGTLMEIVYTSGTTGDPKGVMLTHNNVIANLLAFRDHVEPEPRYRLLSLLPLSHSFEQTIGLCYVLYAGASVVYVQALQPNLIFEALVEERINVIVAVPQVLSLFYKGIEREVRRRGRERLWKLLHALASRLPFRFRRALFPTVHQRLGGHFEFFVVGGATLDPGLARRWENMGIVVLQGYGLTECSPVVAANSLTRRRLDSVGWPIACNQVRIANDGEVLVRGPNVTSGYWEHPSATAAAFEDGWYKTGDIGTLDANGFLYLRGRKKNMIALANGLNVYPEDVENALLQEPGVRDVVVLGVPRGATDIQVHAVLLLEPDTDPGLVVRAANRRLAPHQYVRGYTVWPDDDFPRTPTLKAKRAPIAERVSARS